MTILMGENHVKANYLTILWIRDGRNFVVVVFTLVIFSRLSVNRTELHVWGFGCFLTKICYRLKLLLM